MRTARLLLALALLGVAVHGALGLTCNPVCGGTSPAAAYQQYATTMMQAGVNLSGTKTYDDGTLMTSR